MISVGPQHLYWRQETEERLHKLETVCDSYEKRIHKLELYIDKIHKDRYLEKHGPFEKEGPIKLD